MHIHADILTYNYLPGFNLKLFLYQLKCCTTCAKHMCKTHVQNTSSASTTRFPASRMHRNYMSQQPPIPEPRGSSARGVAVLDWSTPVKWRICSPAKYLNYPLESTLILWVLSSTGHTWPHRDQRGRSTFTNLLLLLRPCLKASPHCKNLLLRF
jgi:hypothetical protein